MVGVEDGGLLFRITFSSFFSKNLCPVGRGDGEGRSTDGVLIGAVPGREDAHVEVNSTALAEVGGLSSDDHQADFPLTGHLQQAAEVGLQQANVEAVLCTEEKVRQAGRPLDVHDQAFFCLVISENSALNLGNLRQLADFQRHRSVERKVHRWKNFAAVFAIFLKGDLQLDAAVGAELDFLCSGKKVTVNVLLLSAQNVRGDEGGVAAERRLVQWREPADEELLLFFGIGTFRNENRLREVELGGNQLLLLVGNVTLMKKSKSFGFFCFEKKCFQNRLTSFFRMTTAAGLPEKDGFFGLVKASPM